MPHTHQLKKIKIKTSNLRYDKAIDNPTKDTLYGDQCSNIATALQFVLNIKADELAINTGFIKRQRKATGSNFAKTLLFSWLQNSQPSVEGLVRTGFDHDLKMSAQCLDKRFTAEAGLFMKSVLEEAAGRLIVAGSKVEMELLDRFTAAYIADCSIVTLPAALQGIGLGLVVTPGQAALKLDA